MSDKINVLVIGGGSIGERHVRCFQQTGRADVSLCEINVGVRKTITERYGLNHTFSDLDEAISFAPTAAVVCTPAHLHVAMATRLAAAGIHVLIEKPLSTQTDGIDELIAVVRKRNVVAAVAYVLRAHPVLAAARETVGSGRFGKPVQFIYTGGQHFPHYRPAYREIYYADHATGGGAIQDGLTHLVNAAEWLLGPITELAADAAHLVLEGVEVEDTVHVVARHGTLLATYAMNQHQAPNEASLTVICERGTLRIELHKNRLRWQTDPDDDWHDEQFPPIERDTNFITQAGRFLDAVEGKTDPACTIEEALQTLRVNLAILAAAKTKTWHPIPQGLADR